MSWVKCGFINCEQVALWIPILLISPDKDRFPITPDGAVARAQVGMPLCADHKANTKVDELLTPEGFAQIANQFRDAGRAAPDPDIGLDFEELPKCKGSTARPDCHNPAVVQVIWQGFTNSNNSISLILCSECLPDARRILIENDPAPGIQRQEFDLIPKELWHE